MCLLEISKNIGEFASKFLEFHESLNLNGENGFLDILGILPIQTQPQIKSLNIPFITEQQVAMAIISADSSKLKQFVVSCRLVVGRLKQIIQQESTVNGISQDYDEGKASLDAPSSGNLFLQEKLPSAITYSPGPLLQGNSIAPSTKNFPSTPGDQSPQKFVHNEVNQPMSLVSSTGQEKKWKFKYSFKKSIKDPASLSPIADEKIFKKQDAAEIGLHVVATRERPGHVGKVTKEEWLDEKDLKAASREAKVPANPTFIDNADDAPTEKKFKSSLFQSLRL